MGRLAYIRTKQPPQPAVNWSGSATSGLQIVGTGGQFFMPRQDGTLTINAGSPLIAVGRAGRGPTFSGGAQRFYTSGLPAILSSSPFTIEVLCAVTAVPSLAGFVSIQANGTNEGTTRGLIAFGGGSNRNIYFWGSNRDLASGVDWRTDGSLQHVFITSGGAGTTMRFYRDGVQIASGTTPNVTDTAASSQWQLGDTQQTWNSTPTGTIFKHAFYTRELSAREVAALTANPWQVFKAPQRRQRIVPASSGVTGTLAVTLGNDTLASSGTPVLTGSLARTLGSDTLAAAGTTTVLGTLARTLGDDTLAAAGAVGSPVSGTLAATLGNDTLAATGTPVVSGSLAQTLSNDTLVAAGTTTILGSLARTLGNDTLTASGSSGSAVAGSLVATLGNDTLVAVGSPTLIGTFASTLAGASLSASGTTTITGSLAVTLRNDTLTSAGYPGTPPTSAFWRFLGLVLSRIGF